MDALGEGGTSLKMVITFWTTLQQPFSLPSGKNNLVSDFYPLFMLIRFVASRWRSRRSSPGSPLSVSIKGILVVPQQSRCLPPSFANWSALHSIQPICFLNDFPLTFHKRNQTLFCKSPAGERKKCSSRDKALPGIDEGLQWRRVSYLRQLRQKKKKHPFLHRKKSNLCLNSMPPSWWLKVLSRLILSFSLWLQEGNSLSPPNLSTSIRRRVLQQSSSSWWSQVTCWGKGPLSRSLGWQQSRLDRSPLTLLVTLRGRWVERNEGHSVKVLNHTDGQLGRYWPSLLLPRRQGHSCTQRFHSRLFLHMFRQRRDLGNRVSSIIDSIPGRRSLLSLPEGKELAW